MPRRAHSRLASRLASRGYNADREAVTLLARAPDPAAALDRAVDAAPEDALVITADQVRLVLEDADNEPSRQQEPGPETREMAPGAANANGEEAVDTGAETPHQVQDAGSGQPTVRHPSASGGTSRPAQPDDGPDAPVETKGSSPESSTPQDTRQILVAGDVTGRSTGTGTYQDFVSIFRDRYERLSALLTGRVNYRPIDVVAELSGGSTAAIIGMVADIRSTAGGHRLVELEDTTGTFPCLVLADRDVAGRVEDLLLDEVIAVSGTLADDGGVLFVDDIHVPDVPRTHTASTADRHVRAALISDLHVGSQEFLETEWSAFSDWLHSPAADHVEYLLIGGDMVEGVGVYPDQDEELALVDIYEQYETFAERLKEVPGDLEIVMIPGNHDAVRLAEPQPGFDEELRSIMAAHDARIHGNPCTVSLEGVSVLMYHGVSLDEVIAEIPDPDVSYDQPHRAMIQLLQKRHLGPQFGGHIRLAPEAKDYLVIDEIPDIFHAGHTHTFGIGKYHDVLTVNSGCWQAQTSFQRSVNIDPDTALAPIVDLDTLEVEVMSF